ncbi:hypothetical protein BDP27DRAFT_1362409 [Rhodocollybia butyracea]|uniref:Glycan binding protein Y3-like domain-containing protein n=1 Tax=Rhodocollybia butyracea TaxID=206335 RepID=A0A9P5PYY8_9AGAR|nr:hypothetical protein BDP27DRAFT_1362409 [Rhodocollybia butyracea]
MLTTPVVGQVNVECFDGFSGNCSQFITAFCTSIGTNFINLQDSTARCFNAGGSLKCDFTAWAEIASAEGALPNPTNCGTVLTAVSETCPMGGQGMQPNANFVYNVDPNEGICSSNIVLDNED